MSKEVISDRSSENLLLPLTPEKLIDGEKKLQIADVEMLDIVVDVSDLTEKEKLKSICHDTWVHIRKFYEHKIVIIFLPINLNMCFGCSKEPSH